MKYVISPAKTMKEFTYAYGDAVQMPRYQTQTEQLSAHMKQLDLMQLCAFCKVSEKLGMSCLRAYQEWTWDDMGTPAIFTYHGIQYQALKPLLFDETELQYANTHVRILSGLYGALRPLDCVHPYRLEMQAPLVTKNTMNLYQFWTPVLKAELEDECLVDLASQEYSQVIDSTIRNSDHYVRIEFYIEKNGKRKAISTAIKAARGAMLHEIIKRQLTEREALKDIEVQGFTYRHDLSNDRLFIYVKEQST